MAIRKSVLMMTNTGTNWNVMVNQFAEMPIMDIPMVYIPFR